MAVNDSTDSPAYNLDQAKVYKCDGNARFKEGARKQAISKYHRALLYLRGIEESQRRAQHLPGQQSVEPLSEDMQQEVETLKVDCYNNLAACLLQGETPDYPKIVQYCDNVLDMRPSNIKALFRKGRSLYHMKEVDDALSTLKHAQNLPEGNKDVNIRKYIQLCQEEQKRQDCQMKASYKAMFDKMAVGKS